MSVFKTLNKKPHYDNSFKILLIKELEGFLKEKNIKDINLKRERLTASNIEIIKRFKNYFLIRNKSHLDSFLSEIKEQIWSDEKMIAERVLDALEGFEKQINTWESKIKGEKNELNSSNPKNINLEYYEIYFLYSEQLKSLHNELLSFIKKRFINFDFNSKKYFTKIKTLDLKKHTSNQTQLMTQKEVAEFLRITDRQVRNLEKNNHFKRITNISSSPRYSRDEIEKYSGLRKEN